MFPLRNFLSVGCFLLIVVLATAQDNSASIYNLDNNSPRIQSKSSVFSDSKTVPVIPELDSRRVTDITRMLNEFEKEFYACQNMQVTQSELFSAIPSVSPNCPLDLENPDFYTNELYYWVNEFYTEYSQLMILLYQFRSETKNREE